MQNKYVKKSSFVDAIQFIDTPECLVCISDFTGNTLKVNYNDPSSPVLSVLNFNNEILKVGQFDYIVRGEDGCLYPFCKDGFEHFYEKV